MDLFPAGKTIKSHFSTPVIYTSTAPNENIFYYAPKQIDIYFFLKHIVLD